MYILYCFHGEFRGWMIGRSCGKEGNPPHACTDVAPSVDYCCSCCIDLCVVGIIYSDVFLVEHGDYPASAILLVLMREFSLIPGVMCMSFAGALMSKGNFAISIAA